MDNNDIINILEKYVDWNELSKSDVDLDFLLLYEDNVNWKLVFTQRQLPENIIKRLIINNRLTDTKTFSMLCKTHNFSEDFIREFKDNEIINWGSISQYSKLSNNFIDEFADKLNWANVSRYQYINMNIINKYIDRISWTDMLFNPNAHIGILKIGSDNLIDILSRCKYSYSDKRNAVYSKYNTVNAKISTDALELFKEDINWAIVQDKQCLTEEEIIRFKKYIKWNKVTINDKSFDFINEFKDKLDWSTLDYYGISVEFINEFKDKLNWQFISSRAKLTEDFIVEFKDYVSWFTISETQDLSESFMRKYREHLDWGRICKCKDVSEEFIEEMQKAGCVLRGDLDWFYRRKGYGLK